MPWTRVRRLLARYPLPRMTVMHSPPSADVVVNGLPCSVFRRVVVLEFKAHSPLLSFDTKTFLDASKRLGLPIINRVTMLDAVPQGDDMRVVHLNFY